MNQDPFDNLTPEEEFAVYESGLCAHGCLEQLDEYMRESIIRYGRILVENIKKEFKINQNEE